MVTPKQNRYHFLCTKKWSNRFIGSVKLLLASVLFLISFQAFSQSIQFDQAQNGKSPGFSITWTNGILNATHTTYYEGVSTPQRLFISGLSGTSHTIKIRHLAESGGKHAYDFLTSWSQAIATAIDIGGVNVNELTNLYSAQLDDAPAEFTGANAANFNNTAFSTSNTKYAKASYLPVTFGTADGTQGNTDDVIDCYNNTYGDPFIEIAGNQDITAFNVVAEAGYTADYKVYTISWTSASDRVMLRFAGHPSIGQGTPPSICGYGSGQGAGSINGGNYHIKLDYLDGSIGERDNQVMANTFQIPPTCGLTGPLVACPETPSLTFTYQGTNAANANLVFTFTSNTANASFANGSVLNTLNATADASGNYTLTVYPASTAGFTAGGDFQVHVAATASGGSCGQDASLTHIESVQVQASADPTSFSIAAANHSSQLNAAVTLDGTLLTDAQADAQFSFSWSQDPPTGGSLSATNIRNPVFTATSAGTYEFTVTATQKDDPNCSSTSKVTVVVTPGAGCPSIGDLTLCAGGSGTVSATGAIPANTHYDWSIVAPANGASITSANTHDVTSVNVQAGTANFTVRLTISYDNTALTPLQCDKVVVVNPVAVVVAGGPNTLCQSASTQQITLSGASVSGGANSGAWSIVSSVPAGGGSLSSTAQTTNPEAVTFTVSANYAGVITLRLTSADPEGPCPAVTADRTITIGQAAVVVAGGPNTVCQSASPSAITLAGASVSGGTTTGTWSIVSGGGSLSNTNPTTDPATVTYTPAANFNGTVTLRLTSADPDGNGPCVAASADRTINVTPTPSCSISGLSEVCNSSSNNYTSTITPSGGTVSHSWSITGNGTITSGTTDAMVTVQAGAAGSYTLTDNITRNGCTSQCTKTVTVNSCDVNCTYTQGYFGNKGGISCNGAPSVPGPNQFTTAQLITNSINTYTLNSYTPALPNTAPFTNQMLVVGKPGHSVYMNSSSTDVSAIIDHLPGGGNSYPLNAGNVQISSSAMSQYLSKQGRINNTLLAQTIALGLNLGIKSSLNGFGLQADKYLVTADVTECGSTQIKDCQFAWDPVLMQWNVTYTPYHVFDKIPAALYNAISPKTVGGLFTYANKALAGEALASGVNLTMIANAVDLINNAFDGCRSFVSWASGSTAPSANSFCIRPPVTTIASARVLREQNSALDANKLNARAYPNPYNGSLSFNFISPVSGKALLEVYDLLGRKLAIVYEGTVNAGTEKTVNYQVPALHRVPMIYKLSVGNHSVYGKLLPKSEE